MIASNIFRRWDCIHNCCISNRRIWVAWKPSSYAVTTLRLSNQLIHCAVTQLVTNHEFHITYIYSHNHEQQRQPLLEELHQISLSIQGAWCLLGDFNIVLSKDDRYGGNAVEDQELQELSNFMADCEVLQMPSSGAFFTWTNKTIWSRIARVFVNSLWHEVFDYTIAKYLPSGLSDHNPVLI